MLESYSPKYVTYKELWERYVEGKLPKGRSLHICSQEEAVQSSVALKRALEVIAARTQIPSLLLKKQFKMGYNLKQSMAEIARFIRGDDTVSAVDIAQADLLIDEFKLYFDFDTPEDLFLEEEIDKISVIIS
jgi:hypothetical protein